MQSPFSPAPSPSARVGRAPGLVALSLAFGLLLLSMVGVTWFNDTLLGRADFADVIGAGQSGGIIGPLSDLESAWFTGLFLPPVILAFVLLLSSLPRSQSGRIIAGVLWLIAAALLLISLAIALPEEVSVAIGPWLIAGGLAVMAVAGWLLASDASRARAQPATSSSPQLQSIPRSPQS